MSRSPLRVGVLSLQGAVEEHISLIKRCEGEGLRVRRPGDLDKVEALIMPGGESTTIGLLLRELKLEEPLKERCAGGMPVMGTCAGMVLLSREVLDGREEQSLLGLMDTRVKRNAFGRQKESFEKDLWLKGLDKPFRGVFIRAPLVVDAGQGVEVLADVEEGMVAVRQNNLLALSFHPELTDDLSIHRYFMDMATFRR